MSFPYRGSPSSGCPIAAIWTRIWWVRPVSIRHRTSEQCRSEHNTSYRVNALFPLAATCIFIRLPGRGAIGRQISPERSDEEKRPFTSARYSFRKTPSSFWRARRSAASRFLAKSSVPEVSLSRRPIQRTGAFSAPRPARYAAAWFARVS